MANTLHDECAVLLSAGRELIDISGLAKWSTTSESFGVRFSKPGFEAYHVKKFGGDHSRYIAWIVFSVGVENLVKSTLKCNNIKCTRLTLDGFLRKDKENNLVGLCVQLFTKHPVIDRNIFLAGLNQLKDFRNRDLHQYAINVRDSNFTEVENNIIPALNELLKALDHVHSKKIPNTA